MGIFDFVKEAGASVFGDGAKKAEEAAAAEAAAAEEAKAQYRAQIEQYNRETSEKLKAVVASHGFSTEQLDVAFDAAAGRATLRGSVETQADREKIVLVVGNTEGIAQVDDQLSVAHPEPQAHFHTVVKGDTLSKIAKEVYGDAMKYPVIFEANKPMLKDPDLIYPGQVLRIPPLS
ncbi:MAG: peptidoglycan-binding protein LysM [Myxococcota bacterium]